MHDVTETLDHKPFCDMDGTRLADTPHVITAEVNQHQMLGAFFFIRQQILLQPQIFGFILAAWARACQRSDRHGAVTQPHQNFRR